MSSVTGIQGSRPPDHNSLDFPKNKCILWDKTSTSKPTFLHIGYYRKPKVCVPEKILKLVQHQCEIYGLRCHTLIGSMVVEDDGEGVQFQVDRLDTRPLVSPDLSANLAPGDLLIPLEVTNNAAKDRIGSIDDFSTALERLHIQCCSKGSIDMSNFVLLRAWGSFYSNSTSSVIHMDFDLVTMSTVFKATPINPVPIALTALSKNLAGPMSLSNTQGMPKSGYLTMDHTRKLLLVLESDPKSASLPIVGIWVSGADFVQHPFVWAACLRYIYNTHLQDRVCYPPDEFLLVLYSKLHTRPEFYQCCTTTGETKFMYELRSGHEVGNLTKALSNPSEDFFEIELSLPEFGDKKSIFDAAVDNFNQSTVTPHSESHEEEWNGMPEDIQPRSAPTPYAEKIPVFKPMVPDVSILWSESSHSLDTAPSHQSPQHPHASSMNSSDIFVTNDGFFKPSPAQQSGQMAKDPPQFNRNPNIMPNSFPLSQLGGKTSQHLPHNHYSQRLQQQTHIPSSVSLSKQNAPYCPSPSIRYTVAHHDMNKVPYSIPLSNPSVTNKDGRPLQYAFPVTTHTRQTSLPDRCASTHDCTFTQASQLSSNAISVSCHQNGFSSQLQHLNQSKPQDKIMGRIGIPYSLGHSPRNFHENVSLSCRKNQIIKRDIVQANPSSQQTSNVDTENHMMPSREIHASNYMPPVHNGSAMHNPSMNQMHSHCAATPQPTFPSSSSQHMNTCHQQNQLATVHHTSNLRYGHATPLNTVVEENSSSATSSSEESCQCCSTQNMQLSRKTENSSDVDVTNNTQNSTKSSDDDSGLSVTPERPVSSPHPNSDPQPSSGSLAGTAFNQPARSTSSAPCASIESVNWENVPPEIKALIVHQNEQLKQLQLQIQFLMTKESQPATLENSFDSQSPNRKRPSSNQHKNVCSVAVNTTLVKEHDEDCISKSVQTSPVKHCSMDSCLPLPSDNHAPSNSQDGHFSKQSTEEKLLSHVAALPVNSNARLENKTQPQQPMPLPLDESLSYGHRLNLMDSELADNLTQGFSDSRSELEHSPSEGNYFMDNQNDSFSTMAEDASDPRQYYDQLMNNIQLFLLNGENENDDPAVVADTTTSSANDTASATGVQDNSHASLTPQINYMSMMLGLGSDSGQSMEINAMAMKYLKDEQLTQIARMRQKGGSDAYSNAKILQKVIGDMKLSTPEVSHLGISPNDLTMGTRKYMERHGLLGENSSNLNEFSSLDHTMKLKTDFSLACSNHGSADNSNNYLQHDQFPRSSANTPVRKEILQKQNQQTPMLPFNTAPESKQQSTGPTRVKGNGGKKDLGASPMLKAPQQYDIKEAFPGRHSTKHAEEERKMRRRDNPGRGSVPGAWRGYNPEADALNTTEEKDEENILDIAKLKQLPKLL